MKSFTLFLWIYLGGLSSIFAQQVLLQGFYWDYPKAGQGYNCSDTLKNKAPELSAAGFTHIWFPPFAGNGNKAGAMTRKIYSLGRILRKLRSELSKKSKIWWQLLRQII